MNVTRNVYFVHDNGTAELLCGDDVVLLDAEDVEKVSKYQWSVGKHGYVTSGAGKNQILLHRIIVDAKDGDYVDHINRNKLNERKENLRICKPDQNNFNTGPTSKCQSGYKGVCKVDNNKWQAQITYGGRAIYLGRFDDAQSAAIAYDTAARELFGEFAFLNFPDIIGENKKDIHHYKRLSEEQVLSIRELYSEGKTIKELCHIYGHSYSSISRIIRGKTFRRDGNAEDRN